MALSSVRFRRALSLSSYIINYHRPSLSAVPSITSSPPALSSVAVNPSLDLLQPQLFPFQSRHFRSSSLLLSSYRKQNINSEEIGPDTILFEGCDFNHWLITMDFPKDPAPSREEMIETYLQTLAKVVGSYEEAKKRMYAFSTTTYQGFQCLVTEEMSEKFRGLPGVVFILPDSYIDPVNKEYGGDKYENGVITPRPPPTQYGRRRAYDDRPNQRRGPMPNQQGNMRPMYGGDTRNFGPQQNLGPQNSQMQPNYGPGGAGDRRDPMTMNNAPGGRDTMPPYQAQNDRGYYNPQGGRSPVEQSDYVPPGQRNISGDNRNYGPPQGVNNGQGGGGNYGQMAGGNYGQGLGGNYQQGVGAAHSQRHPMAGSNYGQGAGGNYGQGVHADYTPQTPVAGGNYGQGVGGNYGQGVGATHTQQTPVTGANYGQGVGATHMQQTPVTGGNYGQGVGAAHMHQTPMAGSYGQGEGNFGQGVGAAHMQQTPMAGGYGQGEGNYGQGVDATHRQEMGSSYGQSYPGHGEHNFSSMEPRNNMQEQRNYAGMAHPGTDQVRH